MGAEETPMLVLLLTIVGMVVLSAYFSSSETAMMAVNRYRLRHLEQEGDPAAKRTNDLLARPDRLLGVILIGNNLVNFSAATVATMIGLRLFGDIGVAAAPIVLTLIFLIFAEVAPKTIAAQFPERIAFPSSYILGPLLKLLYPVVWFVNTISNLVVSPLAKQAEDSADASGDQLTQEEIRTLVNENQVLPERPQNMLLNVLDLEKVTVNDIMVPRAEIVGIDLDDPIEEILTLLASSEHTRLPVYRENINDIVGVLHLRRAVRLLKLDNVSIADVEKQVREPYFVPEATPLTTQLVNFQKEKRRIALVVDEYGDIDGIVTLEDILEEIVGEFTTDLAGQIEAITPLDDGSFEIDAMAQLRDINKALGWQLPTDGPKTLNGFVLEHLGVIPDANAGLEVDGYRLEILGLERNRVLSVRAAVADTDDDADAEKDARD